jgi:uncharacterized membrane protein YfcA
VSQLLAYIGTGFFQSTMSQALSGIMERRHGSDFGMVYAMYLLVTNLGMTIGMALGGALAQRVTITWLYRIFGMVMIVTMFPCAFLLREEPPPKKVDPETDHILSNSNKN